MFNNKVAPDDYQSLRECFFNFASANELTINEAGDVLERLAEDLQNQVCSGKYGLSEGCCGETDNKNWLADLANRMSNEPSINCP
jgi:hypothetical protein